MQLVKCELLHTSKDPTIRELYKTREMENAKLTRVWKATSALQIANAEVELDLKFPSQHIDRVWDMAFTIQIRPKLKEEICWQEKQISFTNNPFWLTLCL